MPDDTRYCKFVTKILYKQLAPLDQSARYRLKS